MNKQEYNLTYPQKNIWLVEKFNSGTQINSIVGTIEIKQDFNTDTFNEAINYVIRNNDAMRIKINENEGIVTQIVDGYVKRDFEVIDLSDKEECEIEKYKQELAKKPIDIYSNLYGFYIIKYSKNTGCILMKIHHLISDAWSCSKIGTAIFDYIENNKNEDFKDEAKPSYLEFIESEKEYEQSEKIQKDELFWKEYLNEIPEPLQVKNVTDKVSSRARRYSVKLKNEECVRISEYCKNNRISPYTLFLSAVSTYLYRVKDSNDFIIGTPVLNRANFKEKNMIGMFISTIPLRVKIEENMKFIDLAQSISRDTLSIFRHQKYPYSKILENVRKDSNVKTNLYNIVLSYQNARTDMINKEKYNTSWIFNETLNDQLQIHISDMDSTGILNLNYDYLVDLFEDEEIKYIHTRIMSIINDAIDNSNLDVENIRIMSREEENKILYEFNDTDTDYPKDKSVIELFEEQVEKTPDNIALVFEDKKMTYRELNEKANQFAHYLIEKKGIKQNDVVGIMLDKSFELMISIISCLKIGTAYVPIETNIPRNRLDILLEECNSKLLITNKNIDKSKHEILNYLNENEINHLSKENLNYTIDKNQIVYIMYTSGTTGTPKGIKINNYNIVSLIKKTNYIEIEKDDRVSQTGSIMFDASTFEYWVALLNGLPLYLINKDVILDPEKFKRYIFDNKITIMFITSALFNQFVEYDADMFKDVRVILTGGEILSVKHMNKIYKTCTNLKLKNVYGPTETTTFATFFDIKKIYNKEIPIGKPLANKYCYIIDKKNRLLPIGVYGELSIGGAGVCDGYINRDDLNKSRFISNKFGKDGKIYKTGDICFFDKDGNVNYIGRKDSQIKIRGYRIELEGIKNKILQNEYVEDCYIFIYFFNNEKQISIAYETNNNEYDESSLKKYLKEILPNYMIPKFFLKLDKLPLNKNGKVDGNAVKELLEMKIQNENNVSSSNSNYEGIYKDIYNIFSKILAKDNINENDNFFDIGGDSILAMKIVTEAISNNITITYSDLYKYPTIKELGDLLIKKKINTSISDGIEKYDYQKINNILNVNKNCKESIKTHDIGNILLLGVTGFLGAHILDEYLNNNKGDVYCIVRRKEEENEIERMIRKLNFFFGEKYDSLIGKRIKIFEGDISKKMFSLNENNYEKIAKNVNTVINASANVKHFGKEKNFYDINVNGVRNSIDFCKKYNKKLIHISTLSVSGNILETGQVEQDNIPMGTTYQENNLYIGQNLDNIYAYTKFIGERIVLEEICNSNLNAKIMRMGNLTGRFYDGKFQPNVEENAFSNRIRAFIKLGVLPENILKFYLEFTPIDYAAKAVIKLSSVNENYNVYHLFNYKHVNMYDVDKIFNNMGICLKHISKEEMTNIIVEKSKTDEGYKIMNGIILDINRNNEIDYNPKIKVLSNFTVDILKKLDFEWPYIGEEYISKYINYLYNIKFLDGGRNDRIHSK